MSVRAWRIVKAKHAAAAFSGEGAKIAGGRWNSPGMAVVYTSGSASLAMLEMLVHLESQDLLKQYVLFEAAFDETMVTSLAPRDLPKPWRNSPPFPGVQQVGDTWLAEKRSAVLQVPSVIVPTEWNYLLDPTHVDFKKIAIGPEQPVRFDPRLVIR
ncbi:MAG: RES family NAD+ phosphorylase [Woeseia sp.]